MKSHRSLVDGEQGLRPAQKYREPFNEMGDWDRVKRAPSLPGIVQLIISTQILSSILRFAIQSLYNSH